MNLFWIFGVFAAIFGFRWIRFRQVRTKLPGLIREGAVILDVRTKGEFASGSAPGSLNIPLHELEERATALDPQKPIVVCCASGTRSAIAARILRRKGFPNVFNAGPWKNAAP